MNLEDSCMRIATQKMLFVVFVGQMLQSEVLIHSLVSLLTLLRFGPNIPNFRFYNVLVSWGKHSSGPLEWDGYNRSSNNASPNLNLRVDAPPSQ